MNKARRVISALFAAVMVVSSSGIASTQASALDIERSRGYTRKEIIDKDYLYHVAERVRYRGTEIGYYCITHSGSSVKSTSYTEDSLQTYAIVRSSGTVKYGGTGRFNSETGFVKIKNNWATVSGVYTVAN
ncbi:MULTISPECIES: hypothetical protein [unclassified Ruminococcus]|uniref:hypothetical protein n=1 Tax=unclassified Ruminococcus TaxID=2608920 RepID=UPI000ACEBA56|nr:MULTISPECIES: hypothetical protein [unclassified Ruminococcus]